MGEAGKEMIVRVVVACDRRGLVNEAMLLYLME